MNEYLKEHPEKAFLLFTKVYIYKTNTKTPWRKLTQEQKDKSSFRWGVSKMFFLSRHRLTEEDIKNYVETDTTELNEPKGTTNSKNTEDIYKSSDYVVYDFFPLRASDIKVLFNTIGLRMIHFIDQKWN